MSNNRRSFRTVMLAYPRMEGRSVKQWYAMGNLQPTKYKGDALILAASYAYSAYLIYKNVKTIREMFVDINEAEDNTCEAGPLFPVNDFNMPEVLDYWDYHPVFGYSALPNPHEEGTALWEEYRRDQDATSF